MGKKRKDRTPETTYNVEGGSSSTSNTLNSNPEWKYDVFLSFAGKDTRLNFTDHLYEAFSRSDIRCFMDDVDLQRGEDINSLFQAIQDSLCAVLVISKNYAKSAWCLDELQKILECQKTLGRRVFPIFYNVNPADVRHQRESFGEALAELEEKFKEDTTKVQNWRTALSEIGNLSEWNTRGKHEVDLIKNIVGAVWSFLSTKLPSFGDNLVGIDSKVAEVIPFLEIGLDDKRFVGIWGMCGVGKTTLARVVFEKLSHKFEICCFLEKVKDVLSKEGLFSLQKSLLSSLQIKISGIFNSYIGMRLIRSRLSEKKVLLVLDDIEDMSQLKDLAESPDWFGKGSRIIITIRDSHLLTSFGVERIYEMKTMNDDESLRIFSKKAFNKNHPEEKYLQYSKSIVQYARGLPLVLQALGCYLCGRSEEAVWRDALDKLKQINPHKNILQVLQISYDGLDEKEQTIFLDVVCLFKRWKKEEVTQIMKGCDLNPVLGINVLIEKTLLVETEGGTLDMHDLYEDLGWYVIQQKFPNSRLQKFGEIKEVLENNKGSGEIEAIVMDNYWDGDKIQVHPEAFSNMSRLRLLLLNGPPKVPTGLKKLSGALKFVRWPRFPLEALPLPLDELVHIEMRRSNIKQFWNGIKSMKYLKFINLSESPNVTETPDFSNVQSLGHLCLSRCASLVKVHESLGVLKELVEVDLHDCESLNYLPCKLETNSLRKLDLGGCKNVKKLPEFGEGMKKLSYLDASHTAITSLPESLGSLTGLRELNLSATGLIYVPTDCLSGLSRLVFLSLASCERLVSLPRLPPQLIQLEVDGCYSMKRKDRSPETANIVGGESSSTSNTLNSNPEWKYDVFLSFAGKDTRLNFTDNLYEAFIRSGIRCFKDDVDIPRGEDINYLLQVIEDSLCTVLVISQNYAKSPWCLDELERILESRENLGRRVFPIFYNVDPSDVEEQRGSFGEAFADLEKEFKGNTTKVQNWRISLSNIGRLSGWDTRDKHEVDLIQNIVGDVWSFLSTKLPSFDDDLVGIDSKVADVIPLLEIGLDDQRFVGIWGMGGVGKTILARVVSEKLSDKFDICCFLEKVKDALAKEGLVSLQKCLLSHLKIKHLKIDDSYKGMQMIRSHLCKKKVLLVLDDIDDTSQLKELAESPDWFDKGSRIIITTRDSHLLTSFGVERIYKMKTMNDDESLQIFSKKAFNKNHPEEKYLEYSKFVVKCVGGLPLALQVLGSYLCGRKEEAVQRDALDKLKQINPYKSILQVLKLSYDGLNEKEQTIFLDIVCFFKHWKKKEVTQILKSCDLNPVLGINVLIEKTLLVETEGGRLDMHDLYEDLGWYIIQQKSPNSRLWRFGEIKEVLENNKGSGEIEAIVLEDKYSKNYIRRDGDIIEVHPEAFSDMNRLRLLLLSCATKVPAGLKKLSCALKFVRWPLFPLEALPLPLDELVHIEMDHSNMKQLWNGVKSMNHLKFIDLRGSPNFTETPDFSNVQSLEHLRLSWCESLVKVHESLGVLKKLVEVDLHDCESLNYLPCKLETNSLRKLDLGGCKNVKKLPEFGEGMKKLSYVDASHTAITSLPESLGSLIGLRYLSLRETGLINLSTDCFSGLVGLVFLSLEGCKWLVSLPRLPPHLIRLEAAGCSSMKHSLDDQIIILVTSLDHECRGQTKYVISDEEEENMLFPYDEDVEDNFFLLVELKHVEPEYDSFRKFIAVMPSGGKIPSWFEPNIKYYDEERDECEIEVEVPPNFHASKWSGVVVCLHLKRCEGRIRWSFKAPEDDRYNGPAGASHGIWGIYGQEDGLCVMVLEFNEKNCWQHLRGDNNFLHIELSPNDDDNCMDILGLGGE